MLSRFRSAFERGVTMTQAGRHWPGSGQVRVSFPFILVLVVVWLSCAATGLAALWRYALTPGIADHAPASWPPASTLQRDPNRFILLMFAHPDCPCTRASVGELGQLMAQAGGRVSAWVVFESPPNTAVATQHSDLWTSARVIPRVSVTLDDGREMRRFGAAVSGQTLIYDTHGRLVFSGGITGARGHWGDNTGLSSALAAVINPGFRSFRAPVFGCALR